MSEGWGQYEDIEAQGGGVGPASAKRVDVGTVTGDGTFAPNKRNEEEEVGKKGNDGIEVDSGFHHDVVENEMEEEGKRERSLSEDAASAQNGLYAPAPLVAADVVLKTVDEDLSGAVVAPQGTEDGVNVVKILSEAQFTPVVDQSKQGIAQNGSCPDFGSLAAAHRRIYDSGLTFSEAKLQLWNLRKTGYLMKRGFRYRKLWVKRFVSLSGRMLKYYEHAPPSANRITTSVPRGRLELTKSTKVEVVPDSDEGKFMFHVVPLGAQKRIEDVSVSSSSSSVLTGGWNLGNLFGGSVDEDSDLAPESNRNSSSVWRFRASSEKERTSWVTAIRRAIQLINRVEVAPTLSGVGSVHYHYKLKEVIGRGRFGDVYSATALMTRKEFAMKVVDKDRRVKSKQDALMLRNEIKAMRRVTRDLEHPNICKLFQAYEDAYKVYLVLEKLNGGDLVEHIADCVSDEEYTEEYVSNVVRQIAGALVQLHKIGVALCDLGPSSLLYVEEESDVVKVCEFGHALLLNVAGKQGSRSKKQSSQAFSRDGMYNFFSQEESNGEVPQSAATYTPERESQRRHSQENLAPFTAPEIVSGSDRGPHTDIWSLGCILFLLLVGYPPFQSSTRPELIRRILGGLQGDKLNKVDWADISSPAKLLLGRMLRVKSSERISAEEVLDSPWVKKAPTTLLVAAHKRLKEYHAKTSAAYLRVVPRRVRTPPPRLQVEEGFQGPSFASSEMILSEMQKQEGLAREGNAQFFAMDLRAEMIRAQKQENDEEEDYWPVVDKVKDDEYSQANFAPAGRFLSDLETQMRAVKETEQLRIENEHLLNLYPDDER